MNAIEKTTASQTAMANAVRFLALDAVERAKSGHPGMPMGMADAAAALFAQAMKFDPSAPHWPDRDRFVLSAGHGSMLQYAIHYLVGYSDMTIEELKRFRQLGAKTVAIPNMAMRSASRRPPGRLGKVGRRRSAWRSANGRWPPVSVRISSITTPTSSPATAA